MYAGLPDDAIIEEESSPKFAGLPDDAVGAPVLPGPPKPTTGLVAGGVRALARGVLGVGEQFGDYAEYNPEYLASGSSPETRDTSKLSLVNRMGRAVSDTAKNLKETIAVPNAGDSEAKRWVFEGFENLPPSVAYFAPTLAGNLAGRALGAGVGAAAGLGTGPGAIATGVAGSLAGGAAGAALGQAASSRVMYGATYQQTMEELDRLEQQGSLREGITAEDKARAAHKAAQAEWQGEAPSSIIEALVFSKLPAGKTVAAILKPGLKQLGKNILKTAPAELGGEYWTSVRQTGAYNELLRPELQQDPQQAGLDVLGPTGVMTAAFNVLGVGGQRLSTRNIVKALEDPATPYAERVQAVDRVAQMLQSTSGPEAATNFLTHARDALENEETTGSTPYGLKLDDPGLLLPRIETAQAGVLESLSEKIANPDADLEELVKGKLASFYTPAGPTVRALLDNLAPADLQGQFSPLVQAGPTVRSILGGLKPDDYTLENNRPYGFNPETPFAEERDIRLQFWEEEQARRAAAFDSANPVIPEAPEEAALRNTDYAGVLSAMESNQFYSRHGKKGNVSTASDFTNMLKTNYPSLVGIDKDYILAALRAKLRTKGRKITEKQQAVIDLLNHDLANQENLFSAQTQAERLTPEIEAANAATELAAERQAQREVDRGLTLAEGELDGTPFGEEAAPEDWIDSGAPLRDNRQPSIGETIRQARGGRTSTIPGNTGLAPITPEPLTEETHGAPLVAADKELQRVGVVGMTRRSILESFQRGEQLTRQNAAARTSTEGLINHPDFTGFPVLPEGGLEAIKQSAKYANDAVFRDRVDAFDQLLAAADFAIYKQQKLIRDAITVMQLKEGELANRSVDTGVTSKFSVDLAEIWNTAANKTYDTSTLGNIAVREVIQNSLDAVLTSIDRGEIKKGTIDLEVSRDYDHVSLTVEDNGIGMSAEDIASRFLTLGDKTKNAQQEGRFGGFGLAKAVILGFTKQNTWKLWSRDVYTDSTLTAAEGKIQYADEKRRGTKLISESDDGRYVFDENASLYALFTEVPKNITLTYNGVKAKAPALGAVAGKQVFTDDTTPNTQVEVTAYKKAPVVDGNDLTGYGIIRLVDPKSGAKLVQGVTWVGGKIFPVIDVVTDLTPSNYGYPLTTSRNDLTYTYRRNITNYLDQFKAQEKNKATDETETKDVEIGAAGKWKSALARAKKDPTVQSMLATVNDWYVGQVVAGAVVRRLETGMGWTVELANKQTMGVFGMEAAAYNWLATEARNEISPLLNLDNWQVSSQKGAKLPVATPAMLKVALLYDAMIRLGGYAAGLRVGQFSILDYGSEAQVVAHYQASTGNTGFNARSFDYTLVNSPTQMAHYMKALTDHELTHAFVSQHDTNFAAQLVEVARMTTTDEQWALIQKLSELLAGRTVAEELAPIANQPMTVQAEMTAATPEVIREFIREDKQYELFRAEQDRHFFEPFGNDEQPGLFDASPGSAAGQTERAAHGDRAETGVTPQRATEQGDLFGAPASLRPGGGEGVRYSTSASAEPLTLAKVKAAFPGQSVTTDKDGSFVVTTPQGIIRVAPVGEIYFDRAAAEAAYGRKLATTEVPVASFEQFPLEGLISLTEAGTGQLGHETFHAAAAMALTPGQLRALGKQFSTEEAAAAEYQRLLDAGAFDTGNSLLRKIYQFFQNLMELVRPTAAGVMRDIASGKVWNQRNARPAGARFALASDAGGSEGQRAAAQLAWAKLGTRSPFFQKWFGGSKATWSGEAGGTPKVYYHGTRKDFNVFNTTDHMGRKKGVFFTENPEFADEYTSRFPEGAEGGNIMPVYLKTENPFDFRDPVHLEQVQKQLGEPVGFGVEQGDWDAIESERIQEVIQALGFDGFYVVERAQAGALEEVNLAVYDAGQVKSAWNSGEFGEGADIRYAAAWHGSPHDFDKFKTDAIGTGEGAQAYGYGLYFAGAKEVAEWYRDNLSRINNEDLAIHLANSNPDAVRIIKSALTMDGFGDNPRMALVGSIMQEFLNGSRPSNNTILLLGDNFAAVRDAILKVGNDKNIKGRLYHVELAPAEDEYLLWDKPLSEQSEKVKAGLTKAAATYPEIKLGWMGVKTYSYLSQEIGAQNGKTGLYTPDDKAASEYLHSLGIRGIKYLDGTSRTGKKENYNYVIFSEDDVSVTAKYSLSSAINGYAQQVQDPAKLLERLNSGAKLDNFLAHFMPVNRMLDAFRDRKQLAPVKELINQLAENWQKQRTTQDDLLSYAGLRHNKALDAIAKEKGFGTDPEKRNQLNDLMAKSTLWQLYPGAEESIVWDDSTWKLAGMLEKTKLSLTAAQAKINADWRKMTPAMREAYTELLESNQRAFAQQKKENIQFIKRNIADPAKQGKLLQQVEARFNQVKGPYFPLMRFGSYVVNIKGVDTYDAEGNLERRGKTYYSAAFESQVDAEEFVRQAKANPKAVLAKDMDVSKLPELEVDPHHRPPVSRQQANIPDSFLSKLKGVLDVNGMVELRKELRAVRREITKGVKDGSMAVPDSVQEKLAELAKAQTMAEAGRLQQELKDLVAATEDEQNLLADVKGVFDGADLDEAVREQLKADFDQLWLAALPESSVMKHFVKRKGTLGYEEDMLRSYLTYHQKHARAMAFIKYGSKIKANLADIKAKANELTDANDRFTVEQFADLMTNHQTHMMTEKVSPVVTQMTKWPFLWYLTSPSVLLVQSTQPYTITVPFLAARFSFSKAMAAVTRSYSRQLRKEFVDEKLLEFNEKHQELIDQLRDLDDNGNTEEMNRLTAKLSAQEKEMLAMAMTPTLSISLSHEAMEFIRSGSEARSKWLDKAGFFMSISETASRKAGFLAAFDLKYQETGNFAAALKLATEAVNNTLYDYSAANRPKIMTGNIGRLMFQFRIYQVQTAFHILKLAADSSWLSTLPKAEKKRAQRELLTLMGMNFALAGSAGLPGIASVVFLMKVLHALLGDDDEPYDAAMELQQALLGLPGGEVLAKGLPALVGMDVSRRIGAGGITNIFQSEPPEGKHGADLAGWYAANMAGASYSTYVTTPLQAAEAYRRGDWLDAFRAAMPKPVKDLAHAYQLSTEGQKTGSGLVLTPAEELNAWQIGLVALGVNPLEMSLASEEQRLETTYSTQIAERRQLLTKHFVQAVESGTQDEVQAAVEAIAEFDGKMPLFALKASDLMEAYRSGLKKDLGLVDKQQMKVQMMYGRGAE